MSAALSSCLPHIGRVTAPAAWQTVDLISDLHLQASEPATFEAWRDFMARTPADAVFILGDLFEVWVGDDAVASDPFLQDCAQVLRQAAQRMHVGLMQGNRDFLLGPAFLAACGVHPLNDPSVLQWGGQNILLSHGDALCLDDSAYQGFRQEVRSAEWQEDFLAQPLQQRIALARAMRQQSESNKRTAAVHADADSDLALRWLDAADASHLVHGHTHQAADHPLGSGQRHVLSDWSLDHSPQRAQVFRLEHPGVMTRIDWPPSAVPGQLPAP
jgi:UDP-2,3-diacylglucosamine hydrolase